VHPTSRKEGKPLSPDDNTDNREITDIIADIHAMVDPLFDAMEWAEDEIDAATRRHPAAADRIWRSFLLLRPAHPRMRTEVLYRSHCRELLDRVAAGQDTRPGTAAECCLALSETSLQVPLRTSAVGLYARMWRLAGLPPAPLTDASEHYEALDGELIDDHEAWLRHKLRQHWRVLPPPDDASPGRRQAGKAA
jgi:hypothetical protein